MHRMLQGDTLTPCLPDDIIFDILSRLPVRSATRFKSVSKCWHSLIRSRIFIEMHLRSGLQTIDRLQLWFSVHPFGFSFHYTNIFKSLNFVTQKNVVWLAPSSSPNLYSLFLPPPYSYRSIYNFFMGSCNGLLCFNLQGRSSMLNLQPFIWNPATGAFRFMSEGDVSAVDVCDKTPLKLKASCFIFRYGFGYDSSIDDYKIVRLVQYSNRESLLQVDLLAVGSNKLRRFQFPLSGGFRSTIGVLLHGSLHWLMYRQFSEYFILRLNLGTENLDELIVQLPHPHKEEADDTSMIRCVKDLSVVDGKLYVVVEYINYKADYVLWVMEEYGVETSWTKRFSRSLFMCDPKERTYQNISLPYPWTKQIMDSRLVYVESLVSPFHVPNPNWRFEE